MCIKSWFAGTCCGRQRLYAVKAWRSSPIIGNESESDSTAIRSISEKTENKLEVMKHCKTLLVLLAATIVMLTSGCSRQTVHPVPIRYNFLDHIPDYDPMLLDTEILSEPHSFIQEVKPLIDKGMMNTQPVAIGYRFVVPQTPDPDPTFPGTNFGAEKTVAGPANEPVDVTASLEIRFRLNLNSGPDRDPLLLNQELKTALVESIGFGNHPSRYNCFQFKLETSPDRTPCCWVKNP